MLFRKYFITTFSITRNSFLITAISLFYMNTGFNIMVSIIDIDFWTDIIWSNESGEFSK